MSSKHVAVLVGSPRVDGNTRALGDALAEGVRATGHTAEVVRLADHVEGHIRDCRACRRPDGSCSIPDGFAPLLLDELLAADAWVYATPLYWYGISAILKSFFDRIFCFIAASYPQSDDVVARLTGKRTALLLAAEESDVGSRLGVLAQVQEASRYMHHEFVGAVSGVGNRRGEVRRDPSDPLTAARELGARLFEARVTDFRVDTPRPGSVWPA